MNSIFGAASKWKYREKRWKKNGYMSPEHAMDGLFSVKSDVLDFGVMA
jgi:hypothetical protein